MQQFTGHASDSRECRFPAAVIGILGGDEALVCTIPVHFHASAVADYLTQCIAIDL